MRLTVMGSSASCAGPGQACAGHYVEAGEARVLLDCGNGVLSNLGRITSPLGLDAVFITHCHPDHFADIYGLQSLLRYAPEGPSEPLALYLPRGLFERMQSLLSERGIREFSEAFVPFEMVAGEPILVGEMTITPHSVQHTDPTFALIVEHEGARLVYTADTAPCDGVYSAAIGADLLLAEATLPERFAGKSPHMTAREAGALAQSAGAGELVLVHVWPTNDRALMAVQAAETFSGKVTVASEFDEFEIVAR